jgi:hypothetical protein
MDRGNRRRSLGQRRIAQALAGYYGQDPGGYGWYAARLGRDGTGAEVPTNVLTSPDWLDLDCPLTQGHQTCRRHGQPATIHPHPQARTEVGRPSPCVRPAAGDSPVGGRGRAGALMARAAVRESMTLAISEPTAL